MPVVDAADPFRYTDLPHDVVAVLGYVGLPGCTPHIWTHGEVKAARKAGLLWAPILTTPQRALQGHEGVSAAVAMAKVLPGYGHRPGWPVFLDVERGVYDANPTGAAAYVAAWRAGMARAGWPDAFVYWPHPTAYTWLPDWTGLRPDTLPGPVAGVQYAGNAGGGRWDESVFAPHVFARMIANRKDGTVALTTADKAWLVKQLGQVQANLDAHLQAIKSGVGGKWGYTTNLDTIMAAVLANKPGAPAGPGGTVDVHTLAADLAAALGPGIAGQVAAELARRLAT